MVLKEKTVNKFSRNTLLAFLIPLAIACGKTPDPTPDPEPGPGPGPGPEPETGLVTVTYQGTDENFPNPERGFYVASEVYEADGRGLSDASMRAARLQGRTLFLLEFHMGAYVQSDISEEYLQTIRAKFESLRKGGVKSILRFCYSNGYSEADKPWDATPEQVNKHLEQLRPIIREFSDVIMVVQAGFIGSWGE